MDNACSQIEVCVAELLRSHIYCSSSNKYTLIWLTEIRIGALAEFPHSVALKHYEEILLKWSRSTLDKKACSMFVHLFFTRKDSLKIILCIN